MCWHLFSAPWECVESVIWGQGEERGKGSLSHLCGSDPGFPWWLSGDASACQAGDLSSIPGPGRSPKERKWQPTPVLLPGISHGRRSLVGYGPWGCKESNTAKRLSKHTCLCVWERGAHWISQTRKVLEKGYLGEEKHFVKLENISVWAVTTLWVVSKKNKIECPYDVAYDATEAVVRWEHGVFETQLCEGCMPMLETHFAPLSFAQSLPGMGKKVHAKKVIKKVNKEGTKGWERMK